MAALVVGGCSAGGGGDANGADSKPGTPTVSPAPPGRYATLPSPCRAVPRTTLNDLLPGAAELPQDQREKVFRGSAAVTYDTDRKVGCSWKADAPNATRSLVIDFERVVSYDPAVSDDDRADTVYEKRKKAAGLSSPTAPAADAAATTGGGDKEEEEDKEKGEGDGKATDTASPSSSATSGGGSDDATPDGTPGSGTPGSGDPEDALPSRLLDNLGDAAFLQDLPKGADSTAQNHTVSVVFRTSNVVVTVRYAEQPALITQRPDGRELQEKAQALARKLAEKLSE
ncbi:lipoprotein [Streptomyces sp. MMG1522]|nr:lipoprotein [Streptomyces sp. MMG1522]